MSSDRAYLIREGVLEKIQKLLASIVRAGTWIPIFLSGDEFQQPVERGSHLGERKLRQWRRREVTSQRQCRINLCCLEADKNDIVQDSGFLQRVDRFDVCLYDTAQGET